jgi:hypothetical protein
MNGEEAKETLENGVIRICDFWVRLQPQSKPRINQCLEVVLYVRVSRERHVLPTHRRDVELTDLFACPALQDRTNLPCIYTGLPYLCIHLCKSLCVYIYVHYTQVIRKLTLKIFCIASLIKNNMKRHAVLKTAVLWDVSQCSLVYTDRFSLIMEAVSIYETSVNIYQNAKRNIPEESHIHIRHRENLKSHRHAMFLWRKMFLKIRNVVTSSGVSIIRKCYVYV